ncbi:MAG: efflux RND transporter periplasmic adaptor subunit [Pseudomonadales bacterium]|nr:efflux RND transporter periplasmic adaptor subunit [Pseudomonadales bacterium]
MKPLLGSLSFLILMGAMSPVLAAGEFDCMIEPAQMVEVRSPVSGILQQVHVRRGQLVSAGDVLATIESSVERSAAEAARFRAQAQGALLSAQNKVAAAREKARRMDELLEEEFVSAQARDDARAELRLAESELVAAQENSQIAKMEHRQSVDQLNRRVLRSPFDGAVVDQYLHPGSMVDGGEGRKPILKIAQTNPLVVLAILPFTLFPELHIGDAVVVVPEKPFTRETAARITTIDRVIDAAAGTFGIQVELDNAKQDLPAGIRCKLRLGQ